MIFIFLAVFEVVFIRLQYYICIYKHIYPYTCIYMYVQYINIYVYMYTVQTYTYICAIQFFFLGFPGTFLVKKNNKYISGFSQNQHTACFFTCFFFFFLVVVVTPKLIRPPPGAEQLTVFVRMNLRGKSYRSGRRWTTWPMTTSRCRDSSLEVTASGASRVTRPPDRAAGCRGAVSNESRRAAGG